jgi:hypothetical protein
VLWIWTQAAPWNYPLAVALTTTLFSLLGLSVWLLLRRVAGATPLALGLLAVYTTSIFLVPSFGWYIQGLTIVFPMLALVWVLLLHLVYLQTGSRLALLLSVGAFVLGLLSWEKALVIPIVVAAVTALYASPGLPLWGGILPAARRHLGLWIAYAVLSLGYLAWYALGPYDQPLDRDPVSAGSALEAVAVQVLHALVPGLVGGPWVWDDTTTPPYAIATTSALVAGVGLVGCAVAWRVLRRAWPEVDLLRVLALLVVTVLPIAAMIVAGRVSRWGLAPMLDLRYLSEIAVLLPLGLALSLRQAAATGGMPRRVVFLVLAVALSFSVSAVTWSRAWHDNPARAFHRALYADLKGVQLGTTLLDSVVPGSVVSSWSRPYNQVSRLIAPLDSGQFRASGVVPAWIVDDTGNVVPARISESVRARTGPSATCGYPLFADGRWTTVRLPTEFRPDLSTGAPVAQLGLATSAPQRVEVQQIDPDGVALVAPDTPASVPEGLQTLVVSLHPEPVAELRLRLVDPVAGACLDPVVLGVATAGEDGVL